MSADQELRKRGYKIHSRPNNAPAVWVKDGKLFEQVNDRCILLRQVNPAKLRGAK